MNASKLIRAAAAVATFAVLAPASAQTLLSTAPVTVTATLTSQCRLAAAAPTLAVAFGTYTAFQVAALTPATPMTFDIECTRNFGTAPTVAWDTASSAGVVKGLQYTLSLTAGTPVAGTTATATVAGTPATITYTLSGSIAGAQAGDASASGSSARTLTMSF
jgi:hypothetical protein